MDMTNLLAVNNTVMSESPTLLLSVVKMLVALLLVLGVMFILYYIGKKLLGKRTSLVGREKLIKILANNYIGVKKQITLVEVAGEWLVLGLTPTQISLLTRIERKEPEKGSLSGHDPGSDLTSSGKQQVNERFQTMLNQSLENKDHMSRVYEAIKTTISQLERKVT